MRYLMLAVILLVGCASTIEPSGPVKVPADKYTWQLIVKDSSGRTYIMPASHGLLVRHYRGRSEGVTFVPNCYWDSKAQRIMSKGL